MRVCMQAAGFLRMQGIFSNGDFYLCTFFFFFFFFFETVEVGMDLRDLDRGCCVEIWFHLFSEGFVVCSV
jgi:hypothetical protein